MLAFLRFFDFLVKRVTHNYPVLLVVMITIFQLAFRLRGVSVFCRVMDNDRLFVYYCIPQYFAS